MIKLVAATLAAFVLGIGGVATAQTFTGDDSPEPRSVSVGTTTNDDTVGTTTLDDTVGTTTDEAGDIPGPCDEAEHANDPRCTGAGTVTGDDDRRDRGHDDRGGDDDGDRRGHNRGPGGGGEDRSGSNSGRG